MSMCQVSRAVHNFANLEKLMGSFIQKVSQNNGNDWITSKIHLLINFYFP